ncbi:MAG: BamA/TamA family outer membrane protein [Acidobacteria bacterium]|nr:BamA/TamA family outer membrane protein [Acidobacteriota bacterium]
MSLTIKNYNGITLARRYRKNLRFISILHFPIIIIFIITAPATAEPQSNPNDIKEIRIHGLHAVPESKVRLQLKSLEGESYSAANVSEDRKRLDRMALFSKIDIIANHGKDGVTLDIELKETLPYLPYPAISITGEQGVTFGGGLKSTNFLGKGSNLAAAGRFGAANEFEVNASSWWRPQKSTWWIIDYSFRDTENKLDDFQESSHEFDLQLGRQVTEKLRIGGRFKFLSLSSDVPGITLSADYRDNIPGIGVIVEYDSRDSWTSPHKGWWNSFDATANGLGADGKFWRFNVDLRRYQPIQGRHGLFFSSLLTMQTGTVGMEIPMHQDFHIGGTNSLRGWDINARRGKNQFLNTLEYRYEFMKPHDFSIKGMNFYVGLQLALFGDAGSAWNTDDEFTRNFIGGGGFGIRLILPYVNMVRFDFGFGQSAHPREHIGVLEKAEYQRRRVR